MTELHNSAPLEMAGEGVPLDLLHLYMQRLADFMGLMKRSVSPGTRLMFRTTAMPRFSTCRCECNNTGDWSMGRPAQVTEMNQASRQAAKQNGFEVIDFDLMLHRFYGGHHYLRDAIHPKDSFLMTALNMALNMFFSAPAQR